MRGWMLGLLALTGCGLAINWGDPDPVGAARPEAVMLSSNPNSMKPKPPKKPTFTVATLTPAPEAVAADTLVMAVTVPWAADDGKGPTDSAVVTIRGWQSQQRTITVGPGPYPPSTTFRSAIDYAQGTSGNATFNLKACAGVWRYGQYVETCSAEQSWVVGFPPPPPPGTPTLNLTKVP